MPTSSVSPATDTSCWSSRARGPTVPSHLLFEPLELLERLAALTPRPRINLVLSHGVLAPHARWRSRAVASQGPRAPSEEPTADPTAPHLLGFRGDAPSSGRASGPDCTPAATRTLHHSAPSGDEHPPLASRPRSWAWADLMRRAFDVDVLACPRCGGRMRLIALIADPPGHPHDTRPPGA